MSDDDAAPDMDDAAPQPRSRSKTAATGSASPAAVVDGVSEDPTAPHCSRNTPVGLLLLLLLLLLVGLIGVANLRCEARSNSVRRAAAAAIADDVGDNWPSQTPPGEVLATPVKSLSGSVANSGGLGAAGVGSGPADGGGWVGGDIPASLKRFSRSPLACTMGEVAGSGRPARQ
jgi:hypothetical protein